MTDQELKEQLQSMQNSLAAITDRFAALDQKLADKTSGLAPCQDIFDAEVISQLHKQTETINDMFEEMNEHLSQVERELKVYKEVAVGKRVSALFDCYEVERERVSELKLNDKRFQRTLDELQVRMAVLENKR